MPKRCETYSGNKGGECTPAERIAHCMRVDWTCPYCGCDLKKANVSIDHILAQVWGGAKGKQNQIACCGSCNSSKKHKLLSDFAAGRGDQEMVKRVRKITRRQLPLEKAKKFLTESRKEAATMSRKQAKSKSATTKNTDGKASSVNDNQLNDNQLNDSQLLDEMLEYVDTAIGSLDMVHEALEEGKEIIPEIDVTPTDALDNAINNLTNKALEIKAKRFLANDSGENSAQ